MHVWLLDSGQNMGYFVYCLMRGYFLKKDKFLLHILAGFPLQNKESDSSYI